MQQRGEVRLGIEGYTASRWILLDYGDIVVHIFDKESRSFYGLEDLWADAPSVAWQEDSLPL
jgi:ribosome-associated protein